MSNERDGAVTLKGNQITLLGPELKVGDKAPDFVCDQGLAPSVSLSDMGDKVKVFNVILSIATPVCQNQTRKFNEELAEVFSKFYKMKLVGLRFFTVYGEWGRPDMFMMQYLNATYDKSKVFYLNNYGNHFRDFTYIQDVCKILKKLIYVKLKNKHSIINICSNKPLKLTSVINKINQLTMNKPRIKKRSMQRADIYKTHGDNGLVKRISGIKKFTDISIGLKNTVKWFLNNKNRIKF